MTKPAPLVLLTPTHPKNNYIGRGIRKMHWNQIENKAEIAAFQNPGGVSICLEDGRDIPDIVKQLCSCNKKIKKDCLKFVKVAIIEVENIKSCNLEVFRQETKTSHHGVIAHPSEDLDLNISLADCLEGKSTYHDCCVQTP